MNAPPILLSTADIQERVRALALEIAADHAGAESLHLVCVLKGAFIFLADLARALPMPCTLDFMAVSSYAACTSRAPCLSNARMIASASESSCTTTPTSAPSST